jgi:DEAD/DEAH box helicase domain-containing protein
MNDYVEILKTCGLHVTSSQQLPGREPSYVSVPSGLHPAVKELLDKMYGGKLYTHQAAAIDESLAGKHVCISTGTASGKSLPFRVICVDQLLNDDSARVLVLYPSRALLHDQKNGWASFLQNFGLKPGVIDGTVPTGMRMVELMTHRVVLMTPDVLQSWLMANVGKPVVRQFLGCLRLVTVDEAHALDGVTATNFAFLIRRLQAVSSSHRMIVCTATLGDISAFLERLTGREFTVIGPEQDGARVFPRNILLAKPVKGGTFEVSVKLLRALKESGSERFIAIADSRKLVDLLPTVVKQKAKVSDNSQEASQEPGDADESDGNKALDQLEGVYPYRAGLEEDDRVLIQEALNNGNLKGVMSTSALEMGVDLKCIKLVVLLNTPPSMKAFWQRAGRTGRNGPGTVILIDDQGMISGEPDGLTQYLNRPIEPNRLYLENRFIQYANALCASVEHISCGGPPGLEAYQAAPAGFLQMLKNELSPEEMVAADLYALKTRAQGGAHREFPLRNAMEQSFKVKGPLGLSLGQLNFSQALREAYPGGVYLYMMKAYRVIAFNYREGTITVRREKLRTTKPIIQTMAFPNFSQGTFSLLKSDGGFVAEVDLQVNQRVTGFREKAGQREETFEYGPGSPYSQQPITRFIRTTGVCWYFEAGETMADCVAAAVLKTFCNQFGIQSRDVGFSRFYAKESPLGQGVISGVAIFDNTNGSLRLTELLAKNFISVVAQAQKSAETEGNGELALKLRELLRASQKMQQGEVSSAKPAEAGGDWTEVIAPGQKAILNSSAGSQEVTVLGCIYTPKGLRYRLEHPGPGQVVWTVEATMLLPVNGQTEMQLWNIMTGETKPYGEESKAVEALAA